MSISLSPLGALAEDLGLRPDSHVLALAVTHSSYAAEHDCASNERLEFLGDAVVDLAIADLIVTEYPSLDEGSGSLVRSRVVNEAALARAAQRLDLGRYVRLGRGEIKANGLERPSLLADAFEAVVAAIYLERGFEAAKTFVQSSLGDDVSVAAQSPDEVDPKTRLRQWSESVGLGVPVYDVTSDGPAHATTFEATVRVGASLSATGRGRSKKSAETDAAVVAWERRSDARTT